MGVQEHKYCAQCGAKISDKGKYCPQCGSKIDTVAYEALRQKEYHKENIQKPVRKIIVLALILIIGITCFIYSQRRIVGFWKSNQGTPSYEFYGNYTYTKFDSAGTYPYDNGTWKLWGNKLILTADEDREECEVSITGREMEIEFWDSSRGDYYTRSYTKTD